MDAMPNTNDLLGSYGITGLKTGTLDDSGSNLLFTGRMTVGDDVSLDFIGVVLGGYTRQSVDADVAALLNSISAGFHEVPLGISGQQVGSYTTPWGESARMVLGKDASIFTWSDTPIEASMHTTTLTTGADGEEVGSVTWTAGPNTVTVPIVLEGSISPPDQWWRLTHPFELGD
jgi:D-alanyl-D-alanine carboxypeptidase (penicillin-binding protein 5/6)